MQEETLGGPDGFDPEKAPHSPINQSLIRTISTSPVIDYFQVREEDAQELARQMVETDPRMQIIRRELDASRYREARVHTDDEIGDYGFFFDHDGSLIFRVNIRNGEISVPAEVPIDELQPNEMKGSSEDLRIISQYVEMLKKSEPPYIHVNGLGSLYDKFILRHGNRRLSAATAAKKPSLKAWVYLRDAQENPLKVPYVGSGNSSRQNLALRLLRVFS